MVPVGIGHQRPFRDRRPHRDRPPDGGDQAIGGNRVDANTTDADVHQPRAVPRLAALEWSGPSDLEDPGLDASFQRRRLHQTESKQLVTLDNARRGGEW